MPPTPEHADQLQDLLEAGDTWPLPSEAGVQHQLREWAAFSETDRGTLKALHPGWNQDHRYVADPLPERIKDAFADLIFGADPEITAAAPPTERDDQGEPTGDSPDQELLDAAVEENELPSQLQDACALTVAEGEAWYRIYVDRDAYDYPVIEWHSRRSVIPLYRGRKVLACAFISELTALAPDAPVVRVGDDTDPAGTAMWRQDETRTAAGDPEVWRYVEIQTTGLTRNLLYKGERSKLGDQVDLSVRDETADLPEEWRHDLEVMLAGRVTNGIAGRLGRSQYAGVRDLLYALNEAASIGEHNARLTLKRRAIMPASAAQSARSGDDEGETVGRAKVRDADLYLVGDDEMMDGPAPMKILEYSFDAEAVLTYDNGLTDKILTRCRVAPQLVGRATEGAQTGPALRARLLDSILAANAKARAWDDTLPKLLRAVLLVMALPETSGGYGYALVDPDTPPSVERSSTLPEDEDAMVVRLATEVGGEFLSRRSAIEERHPDWEPDRIDKELELIDGERAASAPAFGAANGGIRTERPAISLPGVNGAEEQP